MRDYAAGEGAVLDQPGTCPDEEARQREAHERQRAQDLRSVAAIAVIQSARQVHLKRIDRSALTDREWLFLLRLSDQFIRAQLARHGLHWSDCDFRAA